MNFEQWMLHLGLRPSSTREYLRAIEGTISTWAIEANLTAGPLTALTSKAAFDKVDPQIRALAIFEEKNTSRNRIYSNALVHFGKYLGEGFGSDVETDIDQILEDTSLTSTERLNLVKCRIGQGTFRQRVVRHWESCSVTGYTDTSMLVASHIKPWRACTNVERLDPFNGLLLTPNLDRAFDGGLITFDERGGLVLSSLLTEPHKLGISGELRVELASEHEQFMSFHRSVVFRAA